MTADRETQKWERYFRDPRVGDGVLGPPASGIACANIRTALRMLGYESKYGDEYDDAIAGLVLRFQTDSGHTSRDGLFGRGTRRLLTGKLLEKYGTVVFDRMTDPQRKYIFVSYKREDLPRIAPFLKLMTDWGYTIWFDEGIPGGAHWHEHIAEKVAECDFLMVFLSQAAADSKWVQRELKFADAKDKRVVPVLLEEVELGSGLEIILSEYQMIDATSTDFANQLKRAIAEIRRV